MWKDQTIVQLIFFLCQTVVTATLPRNNGCCPSKVKNVAAVLLHQVFQVLPTTTVLLLKWICNCGTVAPDRYLYDVVTHNLSFQGFNSLPGWPSPWRWCRWGEWCKRRGRPCVDQSVLKEFLTNIHGYDTSECNKCRCSSHCQQHMSFRYKCCCREQRWKRCSPTWRRCSCATTTSAASSRISWALSLEGVHHGKF